MIVAEPAATAVTTPCAFTCATPELLDDHVTPRPPRGVPFASSGVAVSDAVCPCVSATDDGDTATDATGVATTLTPATAETPIALAAICVDPIFRAVTSPADDTVATLVSELDQKMEALLRTCPAPSFTCASSGADAPTVSDVDDGEIVIAAAGPLPPLGVDGAVASLLLLHATAEPIAASVMQAATRTPCSIAERARAVRRRLDRVLTKVLIIPSVAKVIRPGVRRTRGDCGGPVIRRRVARPGCNPSRTAHSSSWSRMRARRMC